jgi:isopentenyl-diphosphate delta-isomerase
MDRKDEHIKHALGQKTNMNDFDLVDFVHQSIPSISYEDVDLSTMMFGKYFDYPVYINAMTGGTKKAYEINKKLGMIANHFNIPFALGSLSNAIKEIEIESYTVVRKCCPDCFVIANIGADKDAETAKKAIEVINADALQIHVNALQEVIMPEGERDFSSWKANIKEAVSLQNPPIILKEVGFGMSKETIEECKKLGIQMFDISGRGGTNFANIENKRLNQPMHYLNNHGLSTVQSLLEASMVEQVEIYASGGVRNPFDVVKAIALGAKGVGLSKFFLDLVISNTIEDAINKVSHFLHELKLIMVFLDCKTPIELQKKSLLFNHDLISYMQQRNIIWER